MELKIIGSGLGRTGTMSLKEALEELTGKPSYHMIELLKDSSRLSVLKKGFKSENTDWEAFFKGFGSSVDYPGCLYIQDILKISPEIKVIHTTRDPESWYESVLNTVYRGVPQGAGDILRMIKNSILYKDFRRLAPVFMHNEKIIWNGQFKGKFKDKDFAIKTFQEHEEHIKEIVPSKNLLIYNVKDGWEPLCKFLDLPIPEKEFPKSNKRDVFNTKMDNLLLRGKFTP